MYFQHVASRRGYLSRASTSGRRPWGGHTARRRFICEAGLAVCKILGIRAKRGKLLVLWARPESFFRPEGPAGAEPRPQGRSPGQGADFGPFYAPFAPKRVKFAQVTDPKTSRIAVLFHQGHRTH